MFKDLQISGNVDEDETDGEQHPSIVSPPPNIDFGCNENEHNEAFKLDLSNNSGIQ